MMWLSLIASVLGIVGVVALIVARSAATRRAVTDRVAMERAAKIEVERVGRAQRAAVQEINRLVHVAFDEMLDEVERSRPGRHRDE